MQVDPNDPATLHGRFAVPGVSFGERNFLPFVQIKTPQAEATVFLQGAHLTAWQPAGFQPAILLSHKSDFAPGKPIRGGIPVVFPWFATDSKLDRIDGHPGPSHGFARLQPWWLEEVTRTGDVVHLRFSLIPSPLSRSMGFDHFELTLDFEIGRTLTLRMTVKNTGSAPLTYEQALHSYYEVADIHETAVRGLEDISFIDKTDSFKVKSAEHHPIRFAKIEDRVYNNTAATCFIDDIAGRRRFTIAKSGSNSTIVWNVGGPMPDLGEWDWHEYVAVETANVGQNSITLAPGAKATMELHTSLQPLGA